MASSVADLCKKHSLDADQLAEHSGLDIQRIMAILLGRWTPSPQDRQKIATVLETPVDEILWGHLTPIQHIYGHGPT